MIFELTFLIYSILMNLVINCVEVPCVDSIQLPGQLLTDEIWSKFKFTALTTENPFLNRI